MAKDRGKKKNVSNRTVELANKHSPEGFTGLELLGAEALKLGVRLFGKGVEVGTGALIDRIKSEGPVPYRVLASWFNGTSYCLAFEFHNLTGHGAYIEHMVVAQPKKGIDFDLMQFTSDKPDLSASKGAWQNREMFFPKHIPAQASIQFAVKFGEEPALARADTVGLSYQYTLLDDPDSKRRSLKQDCGNLAQNLEPRVHQWA